MTEGFAHTEAELKSYGYKLTHFFRPNRSGGGVAFLLRKDLLFKKVVINLKVVSFEWHVIRFPSYRYLFVTIYRKQEISMLTFLEEFSDFMSVICNKTLDTLILSGDFNVHFETTGKYSRDLRNLLATYGLQQVVKDSTHKDGHMLDLVFTNPCELSPTVNVISEYACSNNPNIKFDHYPIFFNLPISAQRNTQSIASSTQPQSMIKQYKQWRNVKNLDLTAFKSALSENLVVSHQMKEHANFETKLNSFNKCLTDTLDSFAPVQSMLITSNETEHPKWFDAEYREQRRIRRRLEKLYKRLNTEESMQQYINQRDYCINLANIKQREYYKNIAGSISNQATLFKTVAELWNKTPIKALPTCSNDAKTLANKFNHFFTDKIQSVRDSFSSQPTDATITELDLSQESETAAQLHTFLPATLKELKDIVYSKAFKTSFDDPLPAPVYKSCIDLLLPYLLELVNLSLASGDMSGLKESTIIPILKKSGLDIEVFLNYRPIFNLQFLSKLIEKVVLHRLTDHMTKNGMHCHNQFGYKKCHSTETLLLEIVDETLIGFDRKTATILILLDMSAAFDTVDLNKLISILEHRIGLKGTVLAWFRSFLFGRKQKVLIHGVVSEILLTVFGVPQGSVLGPVLFNIYVASLADVAKGMGVFSSSYADDTNVRIKLSLQFQYYNITQRIPDIMKEVQLWMNTYFLKLNPGKTEIILLCPPQHRRSDKLLGAFIDNSCIRFSNTVKFLGVHMDTFLTFDSHVSAVASSSMYHLKNLSKIKRYLSQEDTKKLVHALISSKLDYCNSIVYGVNVSESSKLQAIQNRAARIVLGISPYTSVTDDMLYDLHWLKVDRRIIFKILLLVHKFFINSAPQWFGRQLVIINFDERLLQKFYFKSKSGRKAFSYVAPRFWNCLDRNIRMLDNTNKFKSSIKTVLFTNVNNIINAAQGYTE